MNKSIYKIALLLGALFILTGRTHATSSRLMTDRDIYVSGEEVLMTVFIPSDCHFKVINLSLTNSSGELIQTANLPLHDFQATGHLYLPDSLSSGSYLITVYSPHVKHQALESKEIVVLNRFENTDEAILVNRAELKALSALSTSDYLVSGLKENYRQGEAVTFQLTGTKEKGSQLAVSVSRCLPGWTPKYRPTQINEKDTSLLTSKEGVVLQGMVRRLNSDEPVANAMVYLSIPDSIPFFDYYQTYDDGRFYFLLPNRYGTSKIVVQAQKDGETNDLKLVVESVGGKLDDGFGVSALQVTPLLRDYMTESIQLVTFRKIYQAPDIVVQPILNEPAFPFPFYGQAAIQVDPDEYYELGDFSEVSKELLEAVRFRNRKGEYHLDIIDYDLHSYMTGNPMVLVDGVPLSDLSHLANMGSKVIDRVDQVPYQRFYGDLGMDGVLAIYTKSGDASTVPESDHLLKLDFEALQTDVQLAEPLKAEKNEPDFRQLLYWNPKYNPQSDGSINFNTPNVNGTYRIHLIERTADGQLLEHTEFFTISNDL